MLTVDVGLLKEGADASELLGKLATAELVANRDAFELLCELSDAIGVDTTGFMNRLLNAMAVVG